MPICFSSAFYSSRPRVLCTPKSALASFPHVTFHCAESLAGLLHSILFCCTGHAVCSRLLPSLALAGACARKQRAAPRSTFSFSPLYPFCASMGSRLTSVLYRPPACIFHLYGVCFCHPTIYFEQFFVASSRDFPTFALGLPSLCISLLPWLPCGHTVFEGNVMFLLTSVLLLRGGSVPHFRELLGPFIYINIIWSTPLHTQQEAGARRSCTHIRSHRSHGFPTLHDSPTLKSLHFSLLFLHLILHFLYGRLISSATPYSKLGRNLLSPTNA